MENIDDDWESFLQNEYDEDDIDIEAKINKNNYDNNFVNPHLMDVNNIPKCSDIYISTKTKISYLNKQNIDIFPFCTCCDKKRFYSYNRNKTTKRMISFIIKQ